ncbi:helix-turn-helix domain-containing protein [Halorussus sp. MSC15.2]|uniref:helix-turn-helix domain-containing protein n=1 Tax=Halorussus sp. MSC15.2 TaxID=2283638 RepID=UPI0013CFC2A8|nr:helix-turn-helix domain-containing protein [Halorussus sp. MSC15.2]NEU55526.1 helix-turn-helix domain-containing protein [Halorussus sp. MSC15.2]
MPTAKLHITLPEDVWVSEVSTAHPDAEFRVLAAFPAEETGVGLLEITSSDLRAVVGDMDDREDVVRLDIQQASEESALVEFETTAPLLLFSVQESGLPLELPFVIEDGEAEVEITASRDRLSAFTAQLDAFGMSFDVEYVRELVNSESLLTDRQRELLNAAVEEGYYDTPRECSLTELAEEAGVAKSTASETLHRVEEKIVKEYVEG